MALLLSLKQVDVMINVQELTLVLKACRLLRALRVLALLHKIVRHDSRLLCHPNVLALFILGRIHLVLLCLLYFLESCVIGGILPCLFLLAKRAALWLVYIGRILHYHH